MAKKDQTLEFDPKAEDVVFSEQWKDRDEHPGNSFYTKRLSEFAAKLPLTTEEAEYSPMAAAVVDLVLKGGGKLIRPMPDELEPSNCVIIARDSAIAATAALLRKTHKELLKETQRFPSNQSALAKESSPEKQNSKEASTGTDGNRSAATTEAIAKKSPPSSLEISGQENNGNQQKSSPSSLQNGGGTVSANHASVAPVTPNNGVPGATLATFGPFDHRMHREYPLPPQPLLPAPVHYKPPAAQAPAPGFYKKAPLPSLYGTGIAAPRLITKEQIEDAIPENASCVFHIYDRRVNLDAHASDASMYSLLRSWVQDDPNRFTPAPGSDILEYRTLSNPAAAPATKSDENPPEQPNKECDVISKIATEKEKISEQKADIDDLRSGLIQDARRVKRRKREDFKRRAAADLECLKRRGINLKSYNNVSKG